MSGRGNTERDALQEQVAHLEGRIANLENERASLTGQLEEMYASKSWRITAPFRAVWGIVLTRRRP